MVIVLDTCAAFEIVFNGRKCDFYKNLVAEAEKVIAPSLFDAEVANVLWKYSKAGYIDENNAKLTSALALQLVDEYMPTSEIAVEALHEAIRLNHPVYDMYYMVLARRNAATLLTVDEKLKEICKANGVETL